MKSWKLEKDTTVLIHPLSDDRRFLPIEKKGQVIQAVDEFLLVISYNPGYQSVLKELKQSTKQRFMAIEFGYPPKETEIHIVEHEAKISRDMATRPRQTRGESEKPTQPWVRRGRQHPTPHLRRNIN